MSDKEISEQGVKIKAGLLLSKFLRQIGEELTETVEIDGEPVMISKIEALTRKIWMAALGGFVETVDDKGEKCKLFIPPDRVAWSIIFDRLEGKSAIAGEGSKPGGSVPKKVSEQAASRINKAGSKN